MYHEYDDAGYAFFNNFENYFTNYFFTEKPRNFRGKNKKSASRNTQIHTEPTIKLPVNREQMNAQKTCCFCGLVWKPRHNCAAIDRICSKCGEKGHFARVCQFPGETNYKNEATTIGASHDKKKSQKAKKEQPCGKSKTDINDVNNTTVSNSDTYQKDITGKTRNGRSFVNDKINRPPSMRTVIQKGKNNVTANKSLTKEEIISQSHTDANILYQRGNYELAAFKYSELITLCPKSENFYGNRAACYIMMRRYQSALNDAKTAIELNPTYIKGYQRVIRSAITLGNFIEAETAMSQLEKIDPTNEILVSERIKIKTIRGYLACADGASATKNYNEALKNINKALGKSTHCVEYKIKKGEYLALLERYKDAEVVANDILNCEPSNLDAKYILGLCIYQSDVDKAVPYFKDISRLVPDDPKIIIMYKKAKILAAKKESGNNAFRKKNYKEAYKLYSEALEIDPENRGIKKKLYFNQSQISYRLGMIERAIMECTKALTIDPHYVVALMRRGQCYIDQKKYEEAVADLRKACDIDLGKDCQNLLKNAQKLLNAAQSDYHGILGVKKNASHAEIKKAYKEKALLHHPDRHVNSSNAEKIKNEKIFKRITQSYRLLINREVSKSSSDNSDADSNDTDENYMPDYFDYFYFGSFFYSYRNGGRPTSNYP